MSCMQAKLCYFPLYPCIDNGKQCKSKMMSVSLNPSASGIGNGFFFVLLIFPIMIAVRSRSSQGRWGMHDLIIGSYSFYLFRIL